MVMLSIVGDDISQLLPVIYAYKNIISKHILFCDNITQARTLSLKTSMLHFAKSHNNLWDIEVICIDIYVQDHIEELLDKHSTMMLNTGDIHTLWTHKLIKALHEGGGVVTEYDHYTNTLQTLDIHYNISTQTLTPHMNISSYLQLLGYSIVSQQTKASLADKKEHIFKLFQNPSRFKKLRLALLKNDTTFYYKPYDDLLRVLEELHIVKDDKLILSQTKVLAGDLFEEYVFWLCEALNPDDIAMGVKIDFDNNSKVHNPNHRIHNEFDILIMHNNRLFTIECKYSKRLDGLEFVYKYDAIIDYFGKSTKAIIVNISNTPKESYLQMKSSSNFKHSTLRRARLSGIHIYHETQLNVKKFQALVGSFFHIGGNNGKQQR